MASQLQLRRGTTAQHASFTGAAGELTVDTTKKTAVVHDGVTPGGFPLARQDAVAPGPVIGAPVALTGQHAVEFTAIPTTVSQVTLYIAGDVAGSRIQIGDSTGLLTNGYAWTATNVRRFDGTTTATLYVGGSSGAIEPPVSTLASVYTFRRVSTTVWEVHAFARNFQPDPGGAIPSLLTLVGTVELSNPLWRIAITAAGAGNFADGTVTLSYE